MAGPQELEPIAGPRRGVPRRLEPFVLRHREVLEPHRLEHAVLRRTTQQELDHAEGGHGVASDREVGDPTCMLGRSLRVLRRVDQIAAVDAHPCHVFEDRRGERGFACRLLPRLLAQSLDARQVQPTDRRQLEEDAGSVGTGLPLRDRFLQQLEGTSGVARIEVVHGGVDAAPEDACGILGRRDLPGQLREIGGGVGSSPCGGVPCRGVKGFRHLPISSTCREGEVSRSLLRVDDDVRQTPMEAPSGLRRCRGVDGGSEERVCESDPLAASFDDVCLFGLADTGQGSIPMWRRSEDQVDGGPGGRRDDEHRVGRARRKRVEPCSQQLVKVLRNRQWLAGLRPDRLVVEGPRDLQGEERVPLRDRVQPFQDGVREVFADVIPEEADHRVLAERTHSQPVQAGSRHPTQAERVTAETSAHRRQDPDRLVPQTASRERQHTDRSRIQPLDVVDRDDHRAGPGEGAEHGEGCERHRPLVGWRTFDLCLQERGIERALLRAGELGKFELEKVPEGRVGEPGL
jgi:hypothetical protein